MIFSEELHPREETGRFAVKEAAGEAARVAETRERGTLARLQRVKKVAPEVRSAAVSLLRDAGSLLDAIEVVRTSSLETVTDPESRQDVQTSQVLAELESLRPPLPKNEPYVTVHHATDARTAEGLLKDGVIPELKPGSLAAERYEKGEAAEFSPGSGLSRGLYVAKPGAAESYGRVVLELKIPRSFLEVAPEQHSLGVRDPDASLETHDGAVISRPIPPSAIRRV